MNSSVGRLTRLAGVLGRVSMMQLARVAAPEPLGNARDGTVTENKTFIADPVGHSNILMGNAQLRVGEGIYVLLSEAHTIDITRGVRGHAICDVQMAIRPEHVRLHDSEMAGATNELTTGDVLDELSAEQSMRFWANVERPRLAT